MSDTSFYFLSLWLDITIYFFFIWNNPVYFFWIKSCINPWVYYLLVYHKFTRVIYHETWYHMIYDTDEKKAISLSVQPLCWNRGWKLVLVFIRNYFTEVSYYLVSCIDVSFKNMRSVSKKWTQNRIRNIPFPQVKEKWLSWISDTNISDSFTSSHGRMLVVIVMYNVLLFLYKCASISPFCGIHRMTLKTHLIVSDMSCVPNF